MRIITMAHKRLIASQNIAMLLVLCLVQSAPKPEAFISSNTLILRQQTIATLRLFALLFQHVHPYALHNYVFNGLASTHIVILYIVYKIRSSKIFC